MLAAREEACADICKADLWGWGTSKAKSYFLHPPAPFCTSLHPHMGGPLLPFSICPPLGPETHRCVLFSTMSLSLYDNFHPAYTWLCAGEEENGAGHRRESGGRASQAGMVNTVKLLLMSQQSGLDVGEQEGHRTPFGTDGSSTPHPRATSHSHLSGLVLCPWLLGISPRDSSKWHCREHCGFQPPLSGYQGGQT